VARARFVLETRIARISPARVYAELVDPRRQLGLQPLLTSVTEVAGSFDTKTGVVARHFEAVEVFRALGIQWFRNRIRVRVVPLEPGRRVDFEARSRPGIVVRSSFELSPDGDGTRVRESVELHSPAVLMGFVRREGRAAQIALLANLKARLES
jgi:hypothetical protein